MTLQDDAGHSPKSLRFRRDREETWRELESIIEQAERFGIRRLPAKQLTRLPMLYRATLSALSVARSISLDRNVREYLEGLVRRSFFWVYGVRRPFGVALADLIGVRFPSAVRRSWRPVALAYAILLMGAVTGFVLVSQDVSWYSSLIPTEKSQGRDPSADTETLRSVLYPGDEDFGDGLAFFASYLFSNNSQVGITAFALGFAAGVPVFYLMFWNGLILGAMSFLYHQRGMGADWWGWILPHGVTELTAIAICGGAGFVVGHSLVFPGRRARLDSLAVRSRDAGVMVLGAVLMLVIAGLIEGFFRQLVQDIVIRYIVVAVTTLAWLLYFVFLGRRSTHGDP